MFGFSSFLHAVCVENVEENTRELLVETTSLLSVSKKEATKTIHPIQPWNFFKVPWAWKLISNNSKRTQYVCGIIAVRLLKRFGRTWSGFMGGWMCDDVDFFNLWTWTCFCLSQQKRLIQEIKMVLRVLTLYLPLPMFWALFDQQVLKVSLLLRLA